MEEINADLKGAQVRVAACNAFVLSRIEAGYVLVCIPRYEDEEKMYCSTTENTKRCRCLRGFYCGRARPIAIASFLFIFTAKRERERERSLEREVQSRSRLLLDLLPLLLLLLAAKLCVLLPMDSLELVEQFSVIGSTCSYSSIVGIQLYIATQGSQLLYFVQSKVIETRRTFKGGKR